jgi:RNA polymerase sigma factor (sigma-70 family)
MTLSSVTAADEISSESLSGGRPSVSTSNDQFETVVKRHSAMVLGVCRRMLTGADAEDAAQAVFILFWQKALHLQNEAQVAAWLHRTAQYVALNAKNSRNIRTSHEQKAAAETPAMSPAAVESAQWNEIKRVLDEEVNRLPDNQRIPFVLFHLQNRSLADVASMIGATVPTVGARLQRSRDNLAGKLKRRGIVLSSSMLAAALSQISVAEAVPSQFVDSVVVVVSAIPATGLTACTPPVAALVQKGVATGLSRVFWIISSLVGAAIGFPLVMIWMLPALQTRLSPDYPLLQGEWREVATERDGNVVNATNPLEYEGRLQFIGRNFRHYQILADGRVIGDTGSYVLDSTQDPALINFYQRKGSIFGVYKLDADSLTICVTISGGPRPDGMSTKNDQNRLLTRYTRIK